MKPKDPQFLKPKGEYRLNQHAEVFKDKRTKRGRDRKANKRLAIQDSLENN